MKKTYIIPNVQAVTIATQQMLAVSGPEVTSNSATKDSNGFYNDGRRGWFDDEED